MQFTQESEGEDWVAQVDFQGREVRVYVDSLHAASEIQSLGTFAMEKIKKAWTTIEQNLVASLHLLYNDDWCDPENGFPPLEREEFLEKIQLTGIWVMDEREALSLVFSDSELFGGHGIDIFWDSDGKMHEATLFG